MKTTYQSACKTSAFGHVLACTLMLLLWSPFVGKASPWSGSVADHSNYDVVYHRIRLTVNPASSAAISNASVTTYFKTTVSNVSNIQFDLDCSNMTVSSVTYHGASRTYTTNNSTDILAISLPNIATLGTLDSVTVFYSGTPVLAPASGVPSGFNYKNHGSSVKAIYTLGEPYTGHNWWPCKETLYDKIDSVDMIITTPNTYKVAGNGVVTEAASGSNTITTWKTRYKIATYMVNFAVANYANYEFTVPIGSDNLLVMNYLYSEDNTNAFKTAANYSKTIIPMFSTLFGTYPFIAEKYGLAECTEGWGALEVQSMTFIASDAYDKYTIAHELAHQWFGDKVTTNSWHQIWLNEGFAKYCENVVFPENLYPSELAAKRSSLKSSVGAATTTYVSDTTSPNNIFIGSTSQPYEKGAMILSMLRAYLGDTKFFNGLRNYLNAPGIAYGFTHVDSLRKYMEAQTPGLDLANFFSDWVTKKGRVKYNIKYQNVTKGIYIQLAQSPTSAGAGYFDTPVPIRITNGSGLDTIIVIEDKRGTLYKNTDNTTYNASTIFYRFSGTPTGAPTLDPNNVSLVAAGTISSDATLSSLINITLPIREIKLTASDGGSITNLNWMVNSDEALSSIVVEKSNDGTHFSMLQSFAAVENAPDTYEGKATDLTSNTGQYYRVKVVKADGGTAYSKVAFVSGKEYGAMHVTPNPVSDDLTVVIPGSFNDGSLNLVITNIAGQIVKRMRLAGSNTVKFSVQELKSGVYDARLVNAAGESHHAKFVKQ